jgi:SNF2 family DNA or RNA helicase
MHTYFTNHNSCILILTSQLHKQAKDFKIGSDQRYALLIISYETFRIHASIINAAAGLGLLICDEGHRLKSSDSTKTMKALEACPATKRLMITGTPVQNNLEVVIYIHVVCTSMYEVVY